MDQQANPAPHPLIEYVARHTDRDACKCGRCIEPGDDKGLGQHTADLVFFKVSIKGSPSAEELRKLCREHEGFFGQVDLFDGVEHSYSEIGGWIGDQGLGLMLMGLGSLLGLWKLMTPRSMFGDKMDDATAKHLAGSGLVVIQAPKPVAFEVGV